MALAFTRSHHSVVHAAPEVVLLQDAGNEEITVFLSVLAMMMLFASRRSPETAMCAVSVSSVRAGILTVSSGVVTCVSATCSESHERGDIRVLLRHWRSRTTIGAAEACSRPVQQQETWALSCRARQACMGDRSDGGVEQGSLVPGCRLCDRTCEVWRLVTRAAAACSPVRRLTFCASKCIRPGFGAGAACYGLLCLVCCSSFLPTAPTAPALASTSSRALPRRAAIKLLLHARLIFSRQFHWQHSALTSPPTLQHTQTRFH